MYMLMGWRGMISSWSDVKACKISHVSSPRGFCLVNGLTPVCMSRYATKCLMCKAETRGSIVLYCMYLCYVFVVAAYIDKAIAS